MKCFEHIFEPSPNELAGGMVTAEPCIMSSLLRRHIIKVRLHTAITLRFRILVDVIDVQR